MEILFSKRLPWYFFGTAVLGFLLAYSINTFFVQETYTGEIAIVKRNDVTTYVTVSGTTEAKNSAKLSFPSTGIIKQVAKDEGDTVKAGDVIASLGNETLTAEYNSARAALALQYASKDELLRGPRDEARTVSETTASIARENLERTKKEYEQIVKNARINLLSSGLEARPINKENSDSAPVITGSYTCDTEGSYTITPFQSKSRSGYSYKYEGIESGTAPAYVDTPAPLGNCGLYIQFDEDEIMYRAEDWTIEIPNTRSSTYVANRNAYELVQQQAANAIQAAEESLVLAEKTRTRDTSAATIEEIRKIDAAIGEAQGRLAAIEARIADVTIRAPFDGVITDVNVKIGEVNGPGSTITIAAENDGYDLKVRIPEIDITKIEPGDKAEVVFDAKTSERIPAIINFVSPIASEIDGVAYYEAILSFETKPSWIRSGLNADVDIIVDQKQNVLSLPRRYLKEHRGTYTAQIISAEGVQSETTVSVGLVGNDGLVEILDLPEGTSVAAP